MAQAPKSDHSASGPSVTLTGEIVSLRCLALDPEKGHGADHSKCAEAALRRGEPAGLLSGGAVYLLTGISDPKIRPVFLAVVREEVAITGVVATSQGFQVLDVSGIQSRGQPVKKVPPAKKASDKKGLRKE